MGKTITTRPDIDEILKWFGMTKVSHRRQRKREIAKTAAVMYLTYNSTVTAPKLTNIINESPMLHKKEEISEKLVYNVLTSSVYGGRKIFKLSGYVGNRVKVYELNEINEWNK